MIAPEILLLGLHCSVALVRRLTLGMKHILISLYPVVPRNMENPWLFPPRCLGEGGNLLHISLSAWEFLCMFTSVKDLSQILGLCCHICRAKFASYDFWWL